MGWGKPTGEHDEITLQGVIFVSKRRALRETIFIEANMKICKNCYIYVTVWKTTKMKTNDE